MAAAQAIGAEATIKAGRGRAEGLLSMAEPVSELECDAVDAPLGKEVRGGPKARQLPEAG